MPLSGHLTGISQPVTEDGGLERGFIMEKMTKKNRGLYDSYIRANASTLSDVYGNYSYNKARAEEAILREMDKLNGFNPKITSNNSHSFSMAFMYPCPETGEVRLRYHTHANVYDFSITE